MQTFIVPYACGFGQNFEPDRVGKIRCRAAMMLAHRQYDPVIVLGCSMPEYSPYNQTLSRVMSNYLEGLGWPKNRIIANAKGYDTITETAAVLEITDQLEPSKIVAVSSWYHIPRIRMIWHIAFRRGIQTKSVQHPTNTKTLISSALSVGFSLWHALRWRNHQNSFETIRKSVLKIKPPKARLT